MEKRYSWNFLTIIVHIVKAHEDIKKLLKDQDVNTFKNFQFIRRSIELAKMAIVIGKLDNKNLTVFMNLFLQQKPPSENKFQNFFQV